MGYVTKPDTGSLFKNDKKESEKHPNAKGSALIGGVEYWIAAWTYETKDGEKYQSMKFERKDAKQGQPQRPKPKVDDEIANDVPW